MALDAGIDVELFSQYALPHERLEDAMATLQFVKDCGVKIRGNSNAQQMQIYFGSDICSNYARYGVSPCARTFPPTTPSAPSSKRSGCRKSEIDAVRQAWRGRVARRRQEDGVVNGSVQKADDCIPETVLLYFDHATPLDTEADLHRAARIDSSPI